MTTPSEYLMCPMPDNDTGSATVGGYLTELLIQLYFDGEGFSGKRPFGNSDWEDDVAKAWVREGILPGEVGDDEWGDEEISYEPSLFLTVLRMVLQDALVHADY